MPAFTSIAGSDAAATPVVHTFTPRDITGNVATWIESTGVPVADKRFSSSLTRVAGSGRTKIVAKLAWPTVQDQTVNGIISPVVVRTAYIDMTLTFDAASSTQERKDVLSVLKDLVVHANYRNTVWNLEGIY